MTKELIMTLYKTNVHIKIYNAMIFVHFSIAEFMRENNVLFAMMATLMSNIHLRKDGSSNIMMTQLTWICNLSMRKYQ